MEMGCSWSDQGESIATIQEKTMVLALFQKTKEWRNHRMLETREGGEDPVNLNKEKDILASVRTLMDSYRIIESKIQSLEEKDPIVVTYLKKSQLDSLEVSINERMVSIDKLKNKILSKWNELEIFGTTADGFAKIKVERSSLKTRVDMPTVAEFLDRVDHESKLTPKQVTTLKTLNEFEIANIELELLVQERVLIGNKVTQLLQILSNLDQEYKNQDKLLDQLESDENSRLVVPEESELVEMESNRITISETLERWKEARIQLIEVASEFNMVITNMEEASKYLILTSGTASNFVTSNGRGIYEIGEEIRYRLVLICLGLQSIQFLLKLESIPYCNMDEVKLLQKAMSYLFVDLRTEERRFHAESCYIQAHHRVLALLAWVDKTILNTIRPALTKKTAEIQDKVKIISKLRLSNMLKKFPQLDVKELDKSTSEVLGNSKEPSKNKFELNLTNASTKPEDDDWWNNLDPASKVFFQTLDHSRLEKIYNEKTLFDDNQKSMKPIADGNVIIKSNADTLNGTVRGNIPTAKKRTNRLTKKASMNNLTQLLVQTNSQVTINPIEL